MTLTHKNNSSCRDDDGDDEDDEDLASPAMFQTAAQSNTKLIFVLDLKLLSELSPAVCVFGDQRSKVNKWLQRAKQPENVQNGGTIRR